MQLISYAFILLWVLAFALYYLVPKRMQWYVLLAAGILFYVIGLKGFPAGLLVTSLTTYACGIYLQKSLTAQADAVKGCADKEGRKTLKAAFEKKRKTAQFIYIVLNIGLLVFYKYAVVALPFLRQQGLRADFLENLVMPLGISFYTLTAISYVVDVGREQCGAETSFFRVLLFLSYFPSVTQGPFNRFSRLNEEFTREHLFDYDNILRGVQRFVWGAFKKLVIADRIGMFVDNVFESDAASTPGSIFALAVIFYMLQLYADFSGYMDMALGVSETFDVTLPENFKRPYFSKSVAEFWRRWHISLGTWFKDYVMFSFVMSSYGRKLSKACKKRWKTMGKHVVSVLGTLLVWFLTGMWHGRTWNYLLWGLYYGVIMSVSLVLEPQYAVLREKFRGEGKRADKLAGLGAFLQMARTWLIVFAADVLIRSESLAQAGAVFRAFVTNLKLQSLFSKTLTSYGLSKYGFMLLFFALFIWLMVSVLEERGKDVRTYLAMRPAFVRWGCYYVIVLLLLVTGIYGGSYDTAVFMYQSF